MITDSERQSFRAQILKQFGVNSSEIDELLIYNLNAFDLSALDKEFSIPMADEPFVAYWEKAARNMIEYSLLEALRQFLVQLNFPIESGISKTTEYRDTVRKGIIGDRLGQGQGLVLQDPGAIELLIHQTKAGKIPILIINEREDFISLVRALTLNNEPVPVPESQGALMVAGYNNWGRIWEYKKQFKEKIGFLFSEGLWSGELKKIIPKKHLYQDKFILLTRDYYSGVTPEQIGIDVGEWKNMSLLIRREHECTHYFTKRVFSSMRNNVLDEFLADFAGILTATGTYRARWFLFFMGLENYPDYRDDGRLQNYRGTPPLSDKAFRVLQKLVCRAAQQVERFCLSHQKQLLSSSFKDRLLLALMHFTLEEMASDDFKSLIIQRLAAI